MVKVHSQAEITASSPKQFSDHLPEAVDLVVIGGGIVGIFTALYANRQGMKVLVVEKGRIAGEQSSRNWGWLRQQGRDAAELPIVMEANRLWEEVDLELNGKTGFVRGGCTYLAREEPRLEKFAEWIEVAKEHQLQTTWLSSEELAKKIDHNAGEGRGDSPWVGGISTPSDARAEPWKAVPAVARLVHTEGVAILEDCAVRSLYIEAGRVVGVVTEHGSVRSEQVVLAGGAWSSLLLQQHGVRLPQLSVKGTVAQTEVLPEILPGMAIDEGLAIRRREDGGYTLSDRNPQDMYLGWHAIRSMKHYLPTLKSSLANPRLRLFGPLGFPDGWIPKRWNSDQISPFEKTRVLDPEPNRDAVESLIREFSILFPQLGRPRILKSWAGMIDFMPDIVPVVDRVSEFPGLILATGMSGHGFGMGPGVGKIVSDIALQKEPTHNLNRFRYSRFFDGSKLKLGPVV